VLDSKLLVVLCLLPCAPAQNRIGCLPLRGVEHLWNKPDLRFVLVGEIHGTNEAPAIFEDLVCSARDLKRSVIVGVELSDQPAVDRYLESDNEQTARRELLSQAEWQNGSDGRTSQAMFRLLQHLRVLKREGAISGAVAFSASRPGESAARTEEHMASALLAAAKRNPSALVIALTGNVHASKKPIAELASYPLMASSLPAGTTISLFVTVQGGEAWNCQSDGCKPHQLSSTHGERRGVDLEAALAPLPGYDGILSTGLRATASNPAGHH
jgi:hypothetical protein